MARFVIDGLQVSVAADSPLARRKRLLRWLRDRLAARGVEAQGPTPDVAGWRLAVAAEAGLIAIRFAPGHPLALVVETLGEADCEYEETVAACEDALRAGVSALSA